jgi:pyrroline-5-carboxylate reductase
MTIKVGFLGFGSMAQAICRGALSAHALSPDSVFFTQRNSASGHQTAASLDITFTSLETLLETVDILVLGIKPQQLSDALKNVSPLPSRLTIVSLLAGTSIETLQSYCEPNTGIVRTMPNTPSLVNKGMTALCYSATINETHLTTIKSILASVGDIVDVQESEMDIVTALSGSGPAFFYAIARDMVAQGTAEGLTESQALSLVSQTLIGAGEMLKNQSKSADALISDVASPGGTTEAGLTTYSELDITSKLKSVIASAAARSRALRQGKDT